MNFSSALLDPDWYPVEQVAPLMQAWIDKHDAQVERDAYYNDTDLVPISGRDRLAFESGIAYRNIYRMLNYDKHTKARWSSKQTVRNQRWVRADALDRLLMAMDLEYLWHVAPEDGGFDYPRPDRVPRRLCRDCPTPIPPVIAGASVRCPDCRADHNRRRAGIKYARRSRVLAAA